MSPKKISSPLAKAGASIAALSSSPPGRGEEVTRRPGGSGVRAAPTVVKQARRSPPTRAAAPAASAAAGHVAALLEQVCEEPPALEDVPDVAPVSCGCPRCGAFHLGPDAAQTLDLVLDVEPRQDVVARLRFEHLRSAMGEPPKHSLLLLVPRLCPPAGAGHAAVCNHEIQISGETVRGKPLDTFDFKHFVLANVPTSSLESLSVEHRATTRAVSLKPQAEAACPLAPEPLEEKERLANLGDAIGRKEKMKELLALHGLERRAGERDVAYALRLACALRSSDFCYDLASGEAAN
eukprot:TRINITY_DN40234_c0_g1_i1.p1 TRINITY_DN40234_c0_g1~~TRINITY_DN40234_c0_g1_i1.p1  ORF type:complete len:294 (+),score=62.85 TRINITY_DN40234_c0_g1_i1:194-1075(+)